MKYAIDRYGIGAEIEVDADDFDNQYYIPQRRTRFYCPECNELVFFRAKGGSHPNQFYHQEKTDRSPECDKRVDGRSNLTISQRVGLPLFITQISTGNFQLNIGFPALGTKTLESAAKFDCTAKISSLHQYRTIKVNQTNFISDSTTLIPVDFVPPHGKNYSISVDGRSPIFEMQRKWSNYADGFDSSGAIFSYGETGGKKIRRGDCISTNRYYYAVTKKDILCHPKISQTEIGKLVLNKTEYNVIRFLIDVSVGNRHDFEHIGLYFKTSFGVWLLECQPELLPVWPPVVQQDYMIPVKSNSNLICAVKSGNAVPTVYTYLGNTAYRKDILTTESGVHTVELSIGQYPTILSVDRKYAGREVTFIAKELTRSKYTYDFSYVDSGGKKTELSKISESDISKGFIVESNSKFDLYFGTVDMVYNHFKIRNKHTSIPDMQGIREICLLTGSNVFNRIIFKKNIESHSYIGDISERIITSAKGSLIPIPIWVNYILQYLKNNNYDELYYSIIKTTIDGKIHIETIRQLRLLDLSFGITSNK